MLSELTNRPMETSWNSIRPSTNPATKSRSTCCYQHVLKNEWTETSPVKRDPGIAVNRMPVSTHCLDVPEGHPYPELHQKQCDQQGEAGDYPLLLRSCKTPTRMQHPDLEVTPQEPHRSLRAGPGAGHETPFLLRKAERVWLFAIEEVPGRSHWDLSIPKIIGMMESNPLTRPEVLGRVTRL